MDCHSGAVTKMSLAKTYVMVILFKCHIFWTSWLLSKIYRKCVSIHISVTLNTFYLLRITIYIYLYIFLKYLRGKLAVADMCF